MVIAGGFKHTVEFWRGGHERIFILFHKTYFRPRIHCSYIQWKRRIVHAQLETPPPDFPADFSWRAYGRCLLRYAITSYCYTSECLGFDSIGFFCGSLIPRIWYIGSLCVAANSKISVNNIIMINRQLNYRISVQFILRKTRAENWRFWYFSTT
jgi:hypothetical protein